MQLKKALIGLVSIGAAAALAFGGTTVSTAFTSDATQTTTANGGTLTLAVTDSTCTVDNIQPGAWKSCPITVKNTGSVPGTLSLTGLDFVKSDGGVDNSNTSTLMEGLFEKYEITNTNISSVPSSFSNTGNTVKNLKNAADSGYNFPELSNTMSTSDITLKPNQYITANFMFQPTEDSGNAWNGASADITLHFHLQSAAGH